MGPLVVSAWKLGAIDPRRRLALQSASLSAVQFGVNLRRWAVFSCRTHFRCGEVCFLVKRSANRRISQSDRNVFNARLIVGGALSLLYCSGARAKDYQTAITQLQLRFCKNRFNCRHVIYVAKLTLPSPHIPLLTVIDFRKSKD